ncbi:GntR family transcriptional regulator [Paraburkholderia antibiotica]|uniref:GntR family transcriptional regulator n=1 Tax=Paraburkholderia antibiotica TaxID=2728839 RepID=A0A7X9X2S9_9BURK|nr:GntR family transcriptional regulator [Paraburkholderia antibiotica]NML30378.1 GntR family transcriptional regulator [Paraburkholderia antibiotica]
MSGAFSRQYAALCLFRRTQIDTRAFLPSDEGGRSGETVERVAEELKTRILEGRFAPGQRLISRDVVEELGISRGSLREAFRRLEADGLIDVVPNRGAVVRKLSHAEVRHVFQIREALEGQAARLAAQNIDAADHRQRLTEVLQTGRRHEERPVFEQFITDNRAFHQEIVRISGNPLLGELIDKYQLPVFMIQLRQNIGSDQMIRNSLAEHEDIAAAILAGNADAAYDAMKRHLWHSANLILSLPTMAQPTLQMSAA